MPQPLKIGKKWKTNLDMPCRGVECRTPQKPLPHTHRKRLSFATREEAEFKINALQRVRKELKEGVYVKGEMSWATFKIPFMKYSLSKNPQTHYRDRLAIRYLEHYYPISELKQITPELLFDLRKKLEDAGKRAWNINRVMTALKAMMRFAELSKYIDPQMWRLVKRIPTPKGRLHYWEIDEMKALYGVCKDTWATVARLANEAGLRREEIRTLKTRNLDFERNRIHIVGDETWIPKDFERRFIPMKDTLRKYLKKTLNGSDYVLGDRRPSLGSMTTYFSRLVRAAKLKGSLHTGRHTYGSHLAMNGIPLSVIKERMGHESIRTTEIYAHLCPDKMQAMYAA